MLLFLRTAFLYVSATTAATADVSVEISNGALDSQKLLAVRYIVQSQSKGPAVVARCRGTDKVVAGGCSADSHPFLLSRSYRWRSLTGEGWECEFLGPERKTTGRAWAICLPESFDTTANQADSLVAQCRVGQRIIGGGCRTSSQDSFLQKSAPLGKSSWQCASKGLSLRTEALCVHEGHALIMVRQTALNWTTAECPQGHIIVSGGCVAKRSTPSHSLQASHPIREAWTCGGRGQQKTAYAVCIAEHNSTNDSAPVHLQQRQQMPQRKQHQQRVQKHWGQKEAGGWKVSAGSCIIDVSGGRPCAMSPDFPKKYRPEDSCVLKLKDTEAVVLEKFDTEMYFDSLKINSASYSGKHTGKKVKLLNTTLLWSTDFYQAAAGWKICKASADEPPG